MYLANVSEFAGGGSCEPGLPGSEAPAHHSNGSVATSVSQQPPRWAPYVLGLTRTSERVLAGQGRDSASPGAGGTVRACPSELS